MTPSSQYIFISRDCLLRPISGGSIYALDILRYLECKSIKMSVLLLTPSKVSCGCMIPSLLPGTRIRILSPGFLKIGRWNIHPLALLLIPLRQILARISIHFPEKSLGKYCANLLKWIKIKTFSTWPTDKLGHFQADPTPGETEYVARILKKHAFEAMILNYICLTPLMQLKSRSNSMKHVVLAHDIWHQRANRLKEVGLKPDLKEWTFEEEANRYKHADKVIGISWEERELFISMIGAETVITVPKAVKQRNVLDAMVAGRCLFVGKDMPTNLDGLNWFLNSVWPLVIESQKNATLHICGSICNSLDKVPQGVILRGIVENLETEYEYSTVVIVPMRTGSGVKIKLTEAVEFQRCCVSTSCGMEGLPAKDDSGILIADDPQSFAANVCRLLAEPEMRQECLAKSSNWASLHLHPDACYGGLLEFLKSE